VLRVAAALTRKSTDTLISTTDLAVAGDLLFSDLDVYVKRIQSIRAADFESEAVLNDLASFAELASGMVKELGFKRDGKWGQNLAKDRAAVAEVMEGLLKKAPREILAALPLSRAGASGKGPRPLDLSRPHAPERTANAKRYAHLMVHSRPFADATAFSAKLKEAFDETANALRTYGEAMLRELRATTAETRADVDVHFEPMLELCALVLGEEETGLIRRRARVPAAA
jgi:hypothetical protein